MKKSKRILALSLAVAMLPTMSFAKEFNDVSRTGTYKWAYTAIDDLSDKGIINGFGDGNYKPEKSVSFQETMVLLKGIMNPSSSEVESALSTYKKEITEAGVDVWAQDAIAVALDRGVISISQLRSAKDNGFVGKNVTSNPAREDIAVFYAKALSLTKSSDTSNLMHKDLSNLSAEKKQYLSALVKAGIFSSSGSNGMFNGSKPIRRAEMAVITKAAYDYGKKIEVAAAKGKIILVGENNGKAAIIIDTGSNKQMSFTFDKSVKVSSNGVKVDYSKLKAGQEAEIKYQKGVGFEGAGHAIEISVKDIVSTQYIGYVKNTSYNGFTVKYTENSATFDLRASDNISTNKEATFTMATNSKVSILGISSSLSYVKADDLVEFSLDPQGYVTDVIVTPKSGTVNGKIKEIGSVDSTRLLREITVTLKDGKDYKFYVRLDNYLKNSIIDSAKVGDELNTYSNYRFIGNKNNSIGTTGAVFAKVRRINTDSYSSRVTGVDLDEYGTGRTGSYTIDSNTRVYLDNGSSYNYTNSDLYKYLKYGSYVEAELNGSYVTKLTVYDNNSYTSFYKVSARPDSALNNYNSKTFRIYNADKIVGYYNNLNNTRNTFDISSSYNFRFDNNISYDFLIKVDRNGYITPIMYLQPTNYLNNGFVLR